MFRTFGLVTLTLTLLLSTGEDSAASTTTADGTPAGGICSCSQSPCVLIAMPGKSLDLTDVVVANGTDKSVSIALTGGAISGAGATPVAAYVAPAQATVTHAWATAVHVNEALNLICTPASPGVVVTISGVQR